MKGKIPEKCGKCPNAMSFTGDEISTDMDNGLCKKINKLSDRFPKIIPLDTRSVHCPLVEPKVSEPTTGKLMR